jgi:hypothetical protein
MLVLYILDDVYLISAEISGSKFKIGYTRRSIDKRIKEFKTGNASLRYRIFKSKWCTKIESRLHKLFKINWLAENGLI